MSSKMTPDEIDKQIKMAWDRGYHLGLRDGGGSPDEVDEMRFETARYRDLRQALQQSFSLGDFMAVKKTWEMMYDDDSTRPKPNNRGD